MIPVWKKCFRNPFGSGTCYEEFTLPFALLARLRVFSFAGNCAPSQDVVKSDGSLFPASIILVLDYPTLSRTPSLRFGLRICIYMYIYMYLTPSRTYISCNYYSSRGISASTAESLGEVRPERSWKIEKSISIFVHELYVNSRASAYEPSEISHYPVRSPPMESKFHKKMKHKNIITLFRNYWDERPGKCPIKEYYRIVLLY